MGGEDVVFVVVFVDGSLVRLVVGVVVGALVGQDKEVLSAASTVALLVTELH